MVSRHLAAMLAMFASVKNEFVVFFLLLSRIHGANVCIMNRHVLLMGV